MPKRIVIRMLCAMLLLSVCINFILLNQPQWLSVQKSTAYNPSEDWTNYVVTLRLDRQSWISDSYARYLKKLLAGEPVLEQMVGYRDGVLEFSKPELIQGANAIKAGQFAQKEEIAQLLEQICQSGCHSFTKETLQQMSREELQQLQDCYAQLAALLNRSNGTDSLADYIFSNDLESRESKDKQAQTQAILQQIEKLLNT